MPIRQGARLDTVRVGDEPLGVSVITLSAVVRRRSYPAPSTATKRLGTTPRRSAPAVP